MLPASRTSHAPGPTPAPHGGLRRRGRPRRSEPARAFAVLIVESDAQVAARIEQPLREAGYATALAETITGGLALLRSGTPRLMFIGAELSDGPCVQFAHAMHGLGLARPVTYVLSDLGVRQVPAVCEAAGVLPRSGIRPEVIVSIADRFVGLGDPPAAR